jgi:hypothetical protein
LGGEASFCQRRLDGARSRGYAVFVVAEEVDVLGRPLDDAVRDEGVPAAEGKAVACGGAQRDSRPC